MSKCEACGGDGQIEYGAYRGEEAGPTRECRLCGGVFTGDVPLETLSTSAKSASAAICDMVHTSATVTDQLLVSTTTVNGVKVRESIFARPVHRHQWSFHVRGSAVHFECVNDCGANMLFSQYGSLLEGKPVEELEMQYLSRRATMIYESHISSMKTAKEVADERLAQLKLENERRQKEAEQDIKYEGWLVGETSGPGRQFDE